MLDELEFRHARMGWHDAAILAVAGAATCGMVALFGTAGAAIVGALTLGYLAAKVGKY